MSQVVGAAGNGGLQQRRKRKQRLAADNLQADVRAVMGTAVGRRVVHWIVEACHLYQTSLVVSSPYVTAFREGERNIGLWLFSELNRMAPRDFETMNREHIDKARSDRLEEQEGITDVGSDDSE
jgi:hypothetical protein